VKSIRARLLVWLLSAVGLGAAAGAAMTYHSVLRESESLFDYQLQQMALSLRDQGFIAPEEAAALANEQADFVVQIWSLDGLPIYASGARPGFPPRAVLGFAQVEVDGTEWRLYSTTARDRVIQVAQPVQVRRRLAAEAALRSVAPLLAFAPLLAAVVWWSVGASLRPLRQLAAEVKRRDADALDSVPAERLPGEVLPLVESINALLSRLRRSFEAQRAFVADAAHELRSPLTALKLQLRLLGRANTEGERHEAFESLAAGIDRAAHLVEQLLTLARSEPGARDAPQGPVDLAETVRLAAADVVPLARAHGIELELEAEAAAWVQGDASGLRILARNLIDNAVRYTPAGGRVELRLRREGDQVSLRVDDSGPGIPAGERDRVFDRFYRGERTGDGGSGSGSDTGSGLGLAIVHSIAERHRAALSLLDSPLGGLRVALRIAAIEPPSP
jgi:two-component system OmpR family sensor kinase/two-component system sensor histidine kinase QseC